MLAFPKVSRPEVSVLMATHGGWSFVEGALSALLANTPPCYELIVVDDVSPDGLAERIESGTSGLKLLRNDWNAGFGPSMNRAAAGACGEALVFLNSDAFVHDGWLPPLRETLGRSETTGAVSPKVLNSDGTLQEAGALLFGSGVTDFYGFGEDRERPEFRFARRVDYASAVCLAVRRRAFHDAGGFDALFAPAYFEDVDLCLRLAAAGWGVVYESRSVVTHLRGASSRPEEASRLWSRNHPLFSGRWKSLLPLRPPYSPREDRTRDLRLVARDAMCEARFLVASERFPSASPASGDAAAFALASALASVFPSARTTVLSLHSPEDLGAVEDLLRVGVEPVWGVADVGRWSSARALQLDVVFVLDDRSKELLGPSLSAWQPQASIVNAEEARRLVDPRALAERLAEEGVALPSDDGL